MNTLEIHALSSVERFVVWALRVGLSPNMSSATAHEVLTTAFRSTRISEALPALLELTEALSVWWHRIQRLPEVHCTCSRTVGDDEWRLLQMLAALQCRDIKLASGYLVGMLPGPGISATLHSGLALATVLGKSGWMIRCARFDAANAPLLDCSPSPSFSRHLTH